MNFFITLIFAFLALLSMTFCNYEDFATFILNMIFSVTGIIIGLAGIILDKDFFEY